MDKSESFDRERILDWLLSIPSPEAHNQPPKPDGGLTFNPDSQVAHNTLSPLKHQHQQQQQQQQQKYHQHPFPSPHQHRRTVPNIFSPLVQWRGTSPRSMSLACTGTLHSSKPATAATPQQSFHRRQKSESPLPDASIAAELPTFATLSPVLPQRKRLSQAPRPERCVAAFDPTRSDAPPVATDITRASTVEGYSLTSQAMINSPTNSLRNSPTSLRNSPTSSRNSPTSPALSRNSPTSLDASRNSSTGPSVAADREAVICSHPAASSLFGRHTHKSYSALLPDNKLGKIVTKSSPNAMSDAVAQGEPELPHKVQGGHADIRVAISPPTSPSSLGRDWSVQGSDLIHPWSPLAFSDSDPEKAEEYWSKKPVDEIVPPPTLADNQYTGACSKSILGPSPLPVSATKKTTVTATTSATLATSRGMGASSRRVWTPSPDLAGEEMVEKTVPVLQPTELAALSLLVGDTLPQLVLFLGMEYSEYERIVSEEPSSQRQSLRFLMKWFYSTSNTCTSQREVLVDALHKCGHSMEAQQLLSGELEEFGQKQYLDFGSPEDYKTSYSFVPSPLPLSSAPPLSQSHIHQHRRSSPSVLTSPPPLPSAASKEPIPPFSPSLLATHPPNEERKPSPFKHMFTFDEEKINNSLPKFLSNWSLEKTPEYPSHHHPHCYTPHPSQGKLRRKSCSDKPRIHLATPNPRDASLLPNQLAGKRSQHHGISESAEPQTSRYASTSFVLDLNQLKDPEQYGCSGVDTSPRFASGVSPAALSSSVGSLRDSVRLLDNLKFHATTRPPISLSDSTLHCASSGGGIMEGTSGREGEKALTVGRRGQLARQDSGIETLYSTI